MSRKIPATRRYAAPCRRIDIVPSRRVAVVWSLWVGLVCVVLLFAVEVPWLARIALCLAVLTANVRAVAGCVLLEGEGVRALQWQEPGEFTVEQGAVCMPGSIAAGSFRLGSVILLRLRTPAGLRVVLIDGRLQDKQAFRRLCRHFHRLPSGGSGRSGEPC